MKSVLAIVGLASNGRRDEFKGNAWFVAIVWLFFLASIAFIVGAWLHPDVSWNDKWDKWTDVLVSAMIAAVPLGLLISGRDWILGRTAAIEQRLLRMHLTTARIADRKDQGDPTTYYAAHQEKNDTNIARSTDHCDRGDSRAATG